MTFDFKEKYNWVLLLHDSRLEGFWLFKRLAQRSMSEIPLLKCIWPNGLESFQILSAAITRRKI